MGRKRKYEEYMLRTSRKKLPENAIEEFDAAARARGMTYAQAQIEETCKRYQKRFTVPSHYKKVSERGSRM